MKRSASLHGTRNHIERHVQIGAHEIAVIADIMRDRKRFLGLEHKAKGTVKSLKARGKQLEIEIAICEQAEAKAGRHRAAPLGTSNYGVFGLRNGDCVDWL